MFCISSSIISFLLSSSSRGSSSSAFIFPSIFHVIYFRCFRAFCSYTRTLCACLCSGFTTSCNSGSVTGCCKFMFLTETPIWVPSQASTLGSCLHIRSISFQKSILNADNHPKMYAINLFPDRKGCAPISLVWYLRVISEQKP